MVLAVVLMCRNLIGVHEGLGRPRKLGLRVWALAWSRIKPNLTTYETLLSHLLFHLKHYFLLAVHAMPTRESIGLSTFSWERYSPNTEGPAPEA